MNRFLVRLPDGLWWRAPHHGYTHNIIEAHPYDMKHATDRKHVEYMVRISPVKLRVRMLS